MKYILVASFAGLMLGACQAEQANEVNQQNGIAAVNAGEISILNAYVLPPFPGRDVAAGFFELKNTGAADRLLSASSPNSRAVEIHNHIEDNGVMRMRKAEAVTLETGGVVTFEPGNYHLMFFGVNLTDNQDKIEVTFNYENAEPVTLMMPIRQRSNGSDVNTEQSKGSGSHYGSGSEANDKTSHDEKKTYGSGD